MIRDLSFRIFNLVQYVCDFIILLNSKSKKGWSLQKLRKPKQSIIWNQRNYYRRISIKWRVTDISVGNCYKTLFYTKLNLRVVNNCTICIAVIWCHERCMSCYAISFYIISDINKAGNRRRKKKLRFRHRNKKIINYINELRLKMEEALIKDMRFSLVNGIDEVSLKLVDCLIEDQVNTYKHKDLTYVLYKTCKIKSFCHVWWTQNHFICHSKNLTVS